MPHYVGPPNSFATASAYERDRATHWSNPRVARAALLRGGIVWRLAVATVLCHGNILKVDDSVDFCDDGLSQRNLTS